MNLNFIFKTENQLSDEIEIDILARMACTEYQNERLNEARKHLIELFHVVKADPKQLSLSSNPTNIGRSFFYMSDLLNTNNTDTLQMIISVAYLFISKAIKTNPKDINLFKDRLLIMNSGHEYFQYTVMGVLVDTSYGMFDGGFDPFIEAGIEIHKMQMADLFLNKKLFKEYKYFKDMKNEFDKMYKTKLFFYKDSKDEVIKSGTLNHQKLFEHLEEMVINQHDIEF